ncbi:MAG: di-trans,poly-cis-decaprenylcistransferase [Candidatus Rokubacteria bacterium]|nr:di-trans,poly-cis-decaprenylcistransferase [Candidatus Rokubacteria bacterium]
MTRLPRLLYYLYARRLEGEVRRGPIPQHVGIILDGNRRWARAQRLRDPIEAYRIGAEKLDEVLAWCAGLGIPAVTLWAFSTENLTRAPEEVQGLLSVIEAKLNTVADDPRIHRRRVRVRVVGKLDLLPDSTLAAARRAEAATAEYGDLALTFALAYGGRQEIVDAVRRLIRDRAKQGAGIEEIVEGVTQEEIGRCLYTADLPDPDLIIRTSGEVRLSGFLLWQSAYSEFYFCDAYWPAFRKIDFLRAIRSYQQRERRFGV